MLVKTPPILLNGIFQEYFDEFNAFYGGKSIIFPEDSEQIDLYIGNQKEVLHYICGKDSETINPLRAQKLLWIKFFIEEKELRDVFIDKETQNIVFVSIELLYVVVVSKLQKPKNSSIPRRKVVTMYVKSKKEIEQIYANTYRYEVKYKRQ